ncbi:PAS domain-containing protein [Pontibacter qinzhouensis]|uniref:PAS domain-containing protein n=1 Tax=Pontibacter qinzhouensis TaxID=2603253 RepID=A0A5C8KD04_9BACT|nr:LuxR C-terminal-related transcriptional regulator [Pontibacter qinzhouensis]TXK52180.1 PAS domain-containing protein [Pontibacter qinzhouensis]
MADNDLESKLQQRIKDLEEELAQTKEKCSFLERVVHELPANIYISDLDEGVVWCNRTNEETLGYSLSEIIEMGGFNYLKEIVHPDDQTVPENSLAHYRHFSGAEYGGIFRARHKQEQEYKWYTGWAKSFSRKENGEVKDILCVDVDLSSRMDTEEQLVAALKDNLKNKNKLLIKNLRKREVQVLNMICMGMSTRAIAEQLFLSYHTVETHRKNIQRKLGTNNVAEMVVLAREAGLG